MSTKILLVKPTDPELEENPRLTQVLEYALAGRDVTVIEQASLLRRELLTAGEIRLVLFAVDLGKEGVNLEYERLLRHLRRSTDLLEGCVGAVITDARTELYTKSTAAELVFAANMAGCTFVGKPLVEGTGSLMNFRVAAMNLGTDDLMEAYKDSARKLVESAETFSGYRKKNPKILALHASSHRTSNTYALWSAVKEKLLQEEEGREKPDIREIGLRNGTLYDCSGCSFNACRHFGEQESCFYGGVIVEDVYPAVREADAVVMICPNYNDAISANMTAFINRLTALYRIRQFYDKAVFAIIVSGYSGNDTIARQLISAMNMNKNFYLPGRFAMLETANDPGTAVRLPGIQARIESFADRIRQTLIL